jgi:hypothetical protein
MQSQTKQISGEDERRVQRAIVLQTLRSDRDARWTGAELQAELGEADPGAIMEALAQLRQAGVLEGTDEEEVKCSRAIIHLDELGLIAI